ncbi:MAG: protein kinase [Sandaracinaceae bacterium]|nr:protein kinase [Sandaracinaceae bacterium]
MDRSTKPILLGDEHSIEADLVRIDDPVKIGRYRLCYELGAGGMATVYLARAEGPGGFAKPVAIKRIHPHLARRRDLVEMFLDEARIASLISHPNVCNTFDFGEDAGAYYLAMEYLVGEPLHVVQRRLARSEELLGSLRWQRAFAKIMADACEGLHAAHELKDERGRALDVVHRDVSPQNIFVTYDGIAKVVDFGVAFATDRITRTVTGGIKGKLGYLAPEQIAHAPYDRRLDVWALGIVLWEGLTGQRLFVGRSEVDTIMAVEHKVVLPPSVVVGSVPRALDDIALKALSRDPEQRYPTARAMARELVEWLGASGAPLTNADVGELVTEVCGDRRDVRQEVVASVMQDEPVRGRGLGRNRPRTETGKRPLPETTVDSIPEVITDVRSIVPAEDLVEEIEPSPLPAAQPPVFHAPPPSTPESVQANAIASRLAVVVGVAVLAIAGVAVAAIALVTGMQPSAPQGPVATALPPIPRSASWRCPPCLRPSRGWPRRPLPSRSRPRLDRPRPRCRLPLRRHPRAPPSPARAPRRRRRGPLRPRAAPAASPWSAPSPRACACAAAARRRRRASTTCPWGARACASPSPTAARGARASRSSATRRRAWSPGRPEARRSATSGPRSSDTRRRHVRLPPRRRPRDRRVAPRSPHARRVAALHARHRARRAVGSRAAAARPLRGRAPRARPWAEHAPRGADRERGLRRARGRRHGGRALALARGGARPRVEPRALRGRGGRARVAGRSARGRDEQPPRAVARREPRAAAVARHRARLSARRAISSSQSAASMASSPTPRSARATRSSSARGPSRWTVRCTCSSASPGASAAAGEEVSSS